MASRTIDADDPPASLMWATQWNGDPASAQFGSGDWAVADPVAEPGNQGGLAAEDPLTTAVVLCLFTDRRRPDGVPAPDGDERRGWHGDYFDVDRAAGEREMGSLLWTLERATLDFQTTRMAEHYAAEALQTLIDQGLVAQVAVSAEADPPNGRLSLSVRCYDAAGAPLLENAFPIF